MFQQDGVSIDIIIGVKNWFTANNVQALPLLAESPDLNLVECIRIMVDGREHAGNKQYESFTELREAFNISWDNFCQREIQSTFDALPNRIFEVIKAIGKS